MKIIWTKRAYQSWLEAAQYIKQEFGQRALEKFQNNTQQWENILSSMPQAGAVEPLLMDLKQKYRSVVISRKNKLKTREDGLVEGYSDRETQKANYELLKELSIELTNVSLS